MRRCFVYFLAHEFRRLLCGTEESALPAKTARALDANHVLRAQRRFKDFDRQSPMTDPF